MFWGGGVLAVAAAQAGVAGRAQPVRDQTLQAAAPADIREVLGQRV